MKNVLPPLFCFIVSFSVWVTLYLTDDYMTYKSVEVNVIDKIIQGGGKCNDNFLLIVRDKQGRIFDINVEPSLYSTTSVGNSLTFELREHDIKQTAKDNFIYFFGKVIAFVFSIIFFFVTVYEIFNKEK